MQLPIIALMLVKKAILQLMAAGPILLLGMIAINSRLHESTWEFIEYGPATSARVSAYMEPVRAVREHLVWKQDADDSDVRYVIAVWLEAYRNGELLDIYPATTVSEGFPGVYQQILSARQNLIQRAKLAARQSESEGDVVAAAHLYTDVLELANIGKYSEFGALSRSSVIQTDVLLKLIELSPKLPDLQQQEILARIDMLNQPNRSITHTVNRLSAVYRADLAREGRSMAIIEVVRDSPTLASAEDTDLLKIDEWRQLSNIDGSLTPLYTSSRLAHYHQTKFREAKAKAADVLNAIPGAAIS